MDHIAACRYAAVSGLESNVVVESLSGHAHSPGCGHELVRHEDHYDYLGDDGMLHHLLEDPDCCPSHASTGLWISHGRFSGLVHRQAFAHPGWL